jgi:hypothetical protein
MPSEYVDLYAAKDRIYDVLREGGVQTYSGILMQTQLPEDALQTALRLMEQEHKVRAVRSQDEPAYQLPPSGFWAGLLNGTAAS